MKKRTIPCATYRLQFSKDFTFAHATELVPYFQALGISHIYASPCLKARANSSHGYDIVDHDSLNPELGGNEQFETLVDTLHAHGMGLILDLVPNHMGIAGGENVWWNDVLENGQASPFASYFDIDWHPIKEELGGKVLLPVLGEHYGKVIENGKLVLEFDCQRGQFGIRYWDHRFPVDPETYPTILGYEIERLAALVAEESHVMTEWHSLIADFEQIRATRNTPLERARAAAGCKQRLTELHGQSRAVRKFLEETTAAFNGTMGEPRSFDNLHQLLAQQSFRLAYWRVAADEINYRRFFDINELAGLCQENPDVFESTHRLVLALIADGSADGLRIDHVDGLYDPAGYCRRLREAVTRMAGEPPTGTGEESTRPLYLVVEKILGGFEHLREDWPVDGTTGYEFSALVNGLFVHPEAEAALTRVYTNFVGRRPPFEEVIYQCKRQVIRTQLSSELTMLTNMLNRIAQADRATRDYTLYGLREALLEVVACFPVYRTYITADGVSSEDRRFVEWAIAQAKKRSSAAADITVFDFLLDILLLRNLEIAGAEYRSRVLRFTMRFQQYTAPVMAKGMEDTAFYAYNRLLSLNEVGGDPRRFSVTVAAFHHANLQRLHRWPHAMLNTSTHDSKRGEDVRARLNLLSELASEWRLHLSRWRRLNGSKKRLVNDAPAPSRDDEYRFYQTLLGAWPLETGGPQVGGDGFRERILSYMLKAVREAKVHTSWINPNPAYDDAVIGFVKKLLNRSSGRRFLEDFLVLYRRVVRFGLYNGLSQTVLKLTCPGIPDVYQGCELWSFTLVDPDNRRPVDFTLRKQLLNELDSPDGGPSALVETLLRNIEDGRAKLYILSRVLRIRQRRPEVFAEGAYLPLETIGKKAGHICAFARHRNGIIVVVIVARWFSRLMSEQDHDLPLGKTVWGETYVQAPPFSGRRHFRDLFSEASVRTIAVKGVRVFDMGTVLANFPVAVLIAPADRANDVAAPTKARTM
jgi:(1->4)-alpha-D-glucan 1-alpha-D-glucosylmutase